MLISIGSPTDAYLERMRGCLAATAAHVEGVVASVVHDALPINNSQYTLVWETTFADQAAIDRYRDHPYHTDVLIELFTSVQFNVTTAFVADSGA
jgi:hypothetical protein